MGGMIAQHLGFAHAGRVKSLTLMMTTSGHRGLPQESLKVRRALLSRPRPGSTPEQKFENVLDHYVGLYGVIGSPGYPADPAVLRERIAQGVPIRSGLHVGHLSGAAIHGSGQCGEAGKLLGLTHPR